MSRERRQVGMTGENIARQYLRGKGYAILCANYRCLLGEIDLVAREGSTVVFFEVRTKTGVAFGSPMESITSQKQERLRRLANYYQQKELRGEVNCRFDLLAVKLSRDLKTVLQLEHIKDILFSG